MSAADGETDPGDDAAGLRLATHGLLLWLAGKVPDELLTRGRGLLAEYQEAQLAQEVAQILSAQGLAVPEGYQDVLAELLEAAGADPAEAREIAVSDQDPAPPFLFQPGDADPDEFDQAVIELLPDFENSVGAWRTWRLPADGRPWPPPKRVYLVEFDDPHEIDSRRWLRSSSRSSAPPAKRIPRSPLCR